MYDNSGAGNGTAWDDAVDDLAGPDARWLDALEEALGPDAVRFFVENEYVEILAGNGYTYFVFGPLRSWDVGDRRRGRLATSWCVFGVDPRDDEDPAFSLPREHFFGYQSEMLAGDSAYRELLSIWQGLQDDPRAFLLAGCDPLAGPWENKLLSRLLRKVGKRCGRKEYLYATVDKQMALRSA